MWVRVPPLAPMNITSRYKPRKVQYFAWSPDMAYAIGLLVTDGCLSPDNRHITFVSKDLEQIRNFKVILELNNKLGVTRNARSEAYRVQFGNVQFFDWLRSIGLMPNKSLIMGEIKLPDKYFVDFLRGHLDGDGSIRTYTDFYNAKKKSSYVYERIFVTFISASEKHILWLHGKIKKIIGVNGAIHRSKTIARKNPMYTIKFAKKESLILLSKIYYSEMVPCLSRKRILYENFLSKAESFQFIRYFG